MSPLLALIVHVLLTTGVCWIWFMSDFPVYLTKVARHYKFLPQNDDFWPDKITYETWLRHEWQDWVNMKDPTLAHLLGCPTCFSTRISLVSAIWVAVWTQVWVLIPFCLVAVPITCTWLKYMKVFGSKKALTLWQALRQFLVSDTHLKFFVKKTGSWLSTVWSSTRDASSSKKPE